MRATELDEREGSVRARVDRRRTGRTEASPPARPRAAGSDGSNLTQLRAERTSNPAWSPGGTRIVYVVPDGEGSSGLFTIATDGTDRLQITDDPDFDTIPQWSRDGTTIWHGTRPVVARK